MVKMSANWEVVEAEYRAVANGVAEASWLRQLLAELHSPLAKSTLVYCVNVSAVYLSTNPVQHQRTKHVEINLHISAARFPLRLSCAETCCGLRQARTP